MSHWVMLIGLMIALTGFVVIWLAIEGNYPVLATVGGVLFGGGVVFGVVQH